MYTQFYGLREKPFSLSPDPRYLYLADSHREALAHLLYGIEQGEGFISITGEVGTGKTTICRTLLHRIEPGTEVAFIFNPQLTAQELLQSISSELGLESEGRTRRELTDQLNRFLLAKKTEGRRVLLIIDEAQNLPPETLEQVRLLSNLETDTSKLVQIILIGQPELDDMLESNRLRQLRQRISVRWRLLPLSAQETRDYVRHRLRIAAGAPRDIFSDLALREIHRRSNGIPRVINLLCDRALLAGYASEARTIGLGLVTQTDKEIRGLARGRVPSGEPGRLRRWAVPAVAAAAIAGLAVLAWQQEIIGPEWRARAAQTLAQLTGGGAERPTAAAPEVAAAPAVVAPSAVDPGAAPAALARRPAPPAPVEIPEAPGIADRPPADAVAQRTDVSDWSVEEADPTAVVAAVPPPAPAADARSAELPAALRPEPGSGAPQTEGIAPRAARTRPAPVASVPAVSAAPPTVAPLPEPVRSAESTAPPAVDAYLAASLGRTAPGASIAASMDALLALWSEPGTGTDLLSFEDARSVLIERGLQTFPLREASLAALRYFDRPALLELRASDGTPRVVLLDHLGAENARLVGVGRAPVRVPAPNLEELWTGTAWVVWRDYEALPPLLAEGQSGAPVAWLQHTLGRLGFYAQPPTGAFDDPTADAVRAFQASRRLTTDGTVGPMTKMALYEALGRYPGPHLGTRRDGGAG